MTRQEQILEVLRTYGPMTPRQIQTLSEESLDKDSIDHTRRRLRALHKYGLYDAFCVRCGLKWVGAWTERGCDGYRQGRGPVRIHEDRGSIDRPSEAMQTSLEGFL